MSKAKPAKSVKPAAAPPGASSAPQAEEPAWRKRAAVLGSHRLAIPLASLALLIPCFWHSRIQAGDLGSHVYNAWLAQLVARGQAPGLTVATQTTNILFDLLLSWGNALFGMAAAQRIAVSLAVLTFTWGAFAFVSTVSGRRAWSLFPALAMLAYGWVYHIGFFNFYMALGLCLGAMALAWHWTPRRAAAALALLALAWIAHALPVMWTLALMAYRWLLDRTPPARRLPLAMATMGIMFVARIVMGSFIETRGGLGQIVLITGADQLFVFDPKYLWLAFVLAILWGAGIAAAMRGRSREVLASAPLHFCLLTAAAVVIFPSWIAVPGYKHALAFIAQRLSLPLAICVCAVAARARPRPWQIGALTAAALVFFGLIYRDEGICNDFEDHLEHLVAQLPPGQRVLNAVNDPYLRNGPVTHMIDRICVGRCWSYANYEPSTAQFRVRVTGPNGIIADNYGDSLAMQAGKYVVKPRDLPLYVVELNAQGNLSIRQAAAGAPVGSSEINLL